MRQKKIAQAILVGFLVCCGGVTFTLAQTTPRYVDAHIHYEDRPNFFEDLVRIYRQHKAVACVSAKREHFDKLAAAARQYADVVIPFLWIELDDSEPKAARRHDRSVRRGCRVGAAAPRRDRQSAGRDDQAPPGHLSGRRR